jgi:hypothetical protein
VLHAVIFYRSGGAIQKIVTTKTNTRDIRSATIIDFIYGWILLFFKELSNIPMSTTWVFLGLLAGRELAMTLALRHRETADAGRIVVRDASKAFAGLAVSVILAFGLPLAHARLSPRAPATAPPSTAAAVVAVDTPITRPRAGAHLRPAGPGERPDLDHDLPSTGPGEALSPLGARGRDPRRAAPGGGPPGT